MKEQRADPNLTVIIKLIESGQLQKRKQHGKDTPEVRSLLRIRKSLKLVKTFCTERLIQITVLLKRFNGNWLYPRLIEQGLWLDVMMMLDIRVE